MTRPKRRLRLFTLTELSVAMIILMLIVYALFRTIGGAQRAWNGSRAMSTMHENASLAMDVIAQDLRSMKVSDVSGMEINYSPDGSGLPTGFRFAFVTTSGLGLDPADGAPASDRSPMTEVAYQYSASDSTLYRWRTTRSAGDALLARGPWNFYNSPATTWAGGSSWEDSIAVITGVEAVTFSARSTSNNNSTISSSNDTTILPTSVSVGLTLVDERVSDAPAAQTAKTRLRFTKTIHLNRSE